MTMNLYNFYTASERSVCDVYMNITPGSKEPAKADVRRVKS